VLRFGDVFGAIAVSILLKELFAVPSIAEARALLRARLSPKLLYHTAEHTDDVLQEAVSFAGADKVSPREVRLTAVAAAWHDAGFTERFVENESLGARLALAAMRGEGAYTPDDEKTVETMILDTRVRATAAGPRQIPSFPLSGYLIDADVSNMGRADFFEKAELVREEQNSAAPRDFYLELLRFMNAHEWYTPAAKKAREKKKSENLAKLREMVKLNGW
jgi:predicted metal-dependent HD superfamily phosphohydrolase